MANFHTHITVAAIASITTAVVLAGANIVSCEFAIWLSCLGTFGGILPDVDSDHSTAIQWVFRFFAIGVSFLVTFVALFHHYSIVIALLIWFLMYCTVLFVVQPLFKNFTVHRGAIHSIPMALLITCAACAFSYYCLHNTIVESWLAGLFLGFGFMIHLILDEMYSVDLSNAKIKRSFGTACKVFSQHFTVSFVVVYFLLFAILFITPQIDVLKYDIFTWHNYHKIAERFWPRG